MSVEKIRTSSGPFVYREDADLLAGDVATWSMTSSEDVIRYRLPDGGQLHVPVAALDTEENRARYFASEGLETEAKRQALADVATSLRRLVEEVREKIRAGILPGDWDDEMRLQIEPVADTIDMTLNPQPRDLWTEDNHLQWPWPAEEVR